MCLHLLLTSTVLFTPMLRHSYLSVYDWLSLQNVLIVAIGQRLVLSLCAVMLRPVTTVPCNLRENGCLVKQSQVSLKVKVCVQILVSPTTKALIILRPCLGCSASVSHITSPLYGLHRPSAVRGGRC